MISVPQFGKNLGAWVVGILGVGGRYRGVRLVGATLRGLDFLKPFSSRPLNDVSIQSSLERRFDYIKSSLERRFYQRFGSPEVLKIHLGPGDFPVLIIHHFFCIVCFIFGSSHVFQ